LPTVSKLLGHSSVYVTATVYSDSLSEDEKEAADIWDRAVQPQISPDASNQTTSYGL
jgi:integrase